MSIETIKRLIICEPALRDNTGHYLSNSIRLASAAASKNIKVEIVCNRGFKALEEWSQVCEFRPEFTLGSWAGESGCTFDSHTMQLESFRRLFKKDLEAVLPREYIEMTDWIMWPSVTGDQLQSIIQYSNSMVDRGALWELTLPYEERWYSYEYNRKAFLELGKSRKHITISTNSAELGKALRYSCAHPIAVRPVPHDRIREVIGEEVSHAAGGCGNSRLRIGYLGNAREEKGFGVVLAALGRIVETDSVREFEFIIQCNAPDQKSLDAISRLSERAKKNIIWIQEAMTIAEYEHIWETIDVILVMYDPLIYKNRVSSVAIDGAVHGKPMIVSSGSWAHKEFPPQMVIEAEFSVDGMVEAIYTVGRRWPSLQLGARGCQAKYVERHSARNIVERGVENAINNVIQNDVEFVAVIIAGEGWVHSWYAQDVVRLIEELTIQGMTWVGDNLNDKVMVISYNQLERAFVQLLNHAREKRVCARRDSSNVGELNGVHVFDDGETTADLFVILGIKWLYARWIVQSVSRWRSRPRILEIWIDDQLGSVSHALAKDLQSEIDLAWPGLSIHVVVSGLVEELALRSLGLTSVRYGTAVA